MWPVALEMVAASIQGLTLAPNRVSEAGPRFAPPVSSRVEAKMEHFEQARGE